MEVCCLVLVHTDTFSLAKMCSILHLNVGNVVEMVMVILVECSTKQRP